MAQKGDFGELLKGYRERLGLTQKALAQAVALTPGYISKLEREDRPPPAQTAVHLADHFKLEGEDRRSFLEAARRVRARHRESRSLKATARVRARVPKLSKKRARPPIGRDKEIEEIIARLAEPEVIVNITGEPAIGKTTVALEVAHRCWGERVVLWGDAREGTAESVASRGPYLELNSWRAYAGQRGAKAEAPLCRPVWM